MVNRLKDSTSPYLLQHRDNPVDWWPWCPEAFAEAHRRNVPVIISVGYSACHWCHVMAHESFEDADTAALMNADFVCIKVDREERPDVDAVYMEATLALSGQGGWPMTVFATPDGKPFYCGTYFPPVPMHGRPSFAQLLTAAAQSWRERPEDVESTGAELVRKLNERRPALAGSAPPAGEALTAVVGQLADSFDTVRGGFGGAPKFPPTLTLLHLVRNYARTGSGLALAMLSQTAEAMARGGLYDQLAGGFARYSVDEAWVVPHFEKMLYDNALLLRVYTHWWRATGSELARRVALETADWMLRDLRTSEGAFASALDADTDGVEGKFYVWTPAQLIAVLGTVDGAWARRAYAVTTEGTFEHGASVLQRLAEPDDPERAERVRAALLDARAGRTAPARDDKVVAAWNGLAVAALAEAGSAFDRPDLVSAASAAARVLADVHTVAGDRLLRTSRDGAAGPNVGVLEDYGDVAEGYLALYAVTGDAEWPARAGRLLDTVLAHFGDGRDGFYDTADDAEVLLRRPQEHIDGVTPSGQAAVAGALLTYAGYTGSARHRAAAVAVLTATAALAERYPSASGWLLATAEALADGPREVAVVGPPGHPATAELHRVALLGTAPGLVVAVGDPATSPAVPLLADRPLVDGSPAAYVCRHFVCEAPTTDPARLVRAVVARWPAG